MISFKTIKYLSREKMGNSPFLYPVLRIIMFRRRNNFVNRDTEICIGGFARSANTFAFHTFRRWNPDTNIAHHLHVIQPIFNAINWGIPCIILIRKPIDALTSSYIINEKFSIDVAINSYVNFYKSMVPYHDKFILATFEEVTTDFHQVIQTVNLKFQTTFFSESLSEEHISATFLDLEKLNKDRNRNPRLITIPTKEKKVLKARVKDKILMHHNFNYAKNVYNELIEIGGTHK